MPFVLLENGKIMASADWQFPGSVYVDYEVVRGFDGNLYAAGDKPEKPFDVVIADAKAALKAHRQFIEHGGVVINGQRWDTEVKDEVRLLEQAVFAATGELQPIEWKVADGVYITLTTEVLSEAVAAFKRHFERCFAIEQQKLVELEGLTSEEEILAWQKGPMLEGWD